MFIHQSLIDSPPVFSFTQKRHYPDIQAKNLVIFDSFLPYYRTQTSHIQSTLKIYMQWKFCCFVFSLHCCYPVRRLKHCLLPTLLQWSPICSLSFFFPFIDLFFHISQMCSRLSKRLPIALFFF